MVLFRFGPCAVHAVFWTGSSGHCVCVSIFVACLMKDFEVIVLELLELSGDLAFWSPELHQPL